MKKYVLNYCTKLLGKKYFSTNRQTPKHIKILQQIILWRQQNIAPIDTDGTQVLSDQNEPKDIQNFQTLIALVLSVQTKDQTTAKIVRKLQSYGLTPQKMAEIEEEELLEMIYSCNFNRKKTRNIIQISRTILDEKQIRKSKTGLIKYPGVGSKISLLYLKIAQNRQEGIAVDTHVHRISNRLGWVNTKTPNQTQKELQLLFPTEYWWTINSSLVGLGQLICKSRKPVCEKCPVKHDCPSIQYF